MRLAADTLYEVRLLQNHLSGNLIKVPANGGEAIQVTRDGGFAPVGKLLYYVKSLEATDVWKVPLEGGQATKVLKGLSTYLNSHRLQNIRVSASKRDKRTRDLAGTVLNLRQDVPHDVAALGASESNVQALILYREL